MRNENMRKPHPRLCHCKKATAIPVTFLMLFVSLILIITATYYVAMTRISARGQQLNFSAAKQAMISLESTINDILWSPGASKVYYFSDFGGDFEITPTANTLSLNVTDGTFADIIFNSPVGAAVYELDYAEPGSSGLYLKGDSRTIVNSSTAPTSRLRMATGDDAPEIVLSYRPLASSTVTGSSYGKPVNTMRLYVVSMNLSQSLTLPSGFYLKVRSVSVTSYTRSYDLSYSISSLQVKAVLNGVDGAVYLPISSSDLGTIINVELLTCNILLERTGA